MVLIQNPPFQTSVIAQLVRSKNIPKLKSNDKVVFLNKGNTCQFKVNDNIISSVDRLDKPFFGIMKYLQDKVYLVINNLVIKRI